jgi:hypothetical protein
MINHTQAIPRKIFMKRLDYDPKPEYKHSRRRPERLRGDAPTGVFRTMSYHPVE